MSGIHRNVMQILQLLYTTFFTPIKIIQVIHLPNPLNRYYFRNNYYTYSQLTSQCIYHFRQFLSKHTVIQQNHSIIHTQANKTNKNRINQTNNNNKLTLSFHQFPNQQFKLISKLHELDLTQQQIKFKTNFKINQIKYHKNTNHSQIKT